MYSRQRINVFQCNEWSHDLSTKKKLDDLAKSSMKNEVWHSEKFERSSKLLPHEASLGVWNVRADASNVLRCIFSIPASVGFARICSPGSRRNCFLKKLSGVRNTITSGVVKTITDGSFLSLQKRSPTRWAPSTPGLVSVGLSLMGGRGDPRNLNAAVWKLNELWEGRPRSVGQSDHIGSIWLLVHRKMFLFEILTNSI